MGRKKKPKSINPYTPLVPVDNGFDNKQLACGFTTCNEESTNSLLVSVCTTVQIPGSSSQNSWEETEEDNSLADLFSDLRVEEEEEDADKSEIPRPLYYGWFFKEDICTALQEISVAYLQQCFFSVPQFERFLLTACGKKDVRDYTAYYRYPAKSRKAQALPSYHVTAKFCGRERRHSEPYGKEFAHLAGTKTHIHIIGLYFTEKTYGFRVKLTEDQQQMFDERDNNEFLSRVKDPPPKSKKEGKKKSSEQRKGHSHRKQSLKDLLEPEQSSFHPEITLLPQNPDFTPSVSRAHITIGVAPKVNAVQTGLDLLDIVNLEKRSQSLFSCDYVLDNGDVLRQFGRFGDAFILYLKKKFIVSAEFNFKP